MAISVDEVAESVELVEELAIPFPLLRDADLSVADAYGVAMLDDELAIPAVFVVTTDGRIHWRTIGESIYDRPSVEALLKVLDALPRARRNQP